MKTNLSSAPPSQLETDCLVVVALDRGDKNKPQVTVDSGDSAIRDAAADVIASGEATGKIFETTLLHGPAKVKAKRLLLLGGGKGLAFLKPAMDGLERTLPNVRRVEYAGLDHGAAADPSKANPKGQPERIAEDLHRFFASQ